jgi:hypothetical protein
MTRYLLQSCFHGASSLTRGRVCLLYMLLALASAVFLESESLCTRDHILLSQIWDFVFVASYDSQVHGEGIRFRLYTGKDLYSLEFYCCYNRFTARIETPSKSELSSVVLSVVMEILCSETCYLVETPSLLYVVRDTTVYLAVVHQRMSGTGSTIPAFSGHVKIYNIFLYSMKCGGRTIKNP